MDNVFVNDVGSGNKNIIRRLKWSLAVGVLTFCLFIISACNSNNKNIVGKWQAVGYDDLYAFTEDGQFVHLNNGGNDGLSIKYSIDNEEIQLDVSNGLNQTIVFADIELSGDRLILSNFADPDDVFSLDEGETMEFTRAD